MVMEVLFFSQLALRSEATWWHEHGVDEEHGEGVQVVFVAKQHTHQRLFVFPKFTQLVVDLFRTQIALLVFAVLLFGLRRVSCGISSL
jgi:hypothetical protein